MRLTREYFLQPTLQLAQDLLGKALVFQHHEGLITETEAYIGHGDPACHGARGKTPRNAALFGPPGHTYVYFIYGMYFCLNVVTEAVGIPAGVLIRGVRLFYPEPKNIKGPGSLCKQLGITRVHNGIDLTTQDDFYLKCQRYAPDYVATPRIGIKVGTEKFWRFVCTVR